jgi:hypothetical protein
MLLQGSTGGQNSTAVNAVTRGAWESSTQGISSHTAPAGASIPDSRALPISPTSRCAGEEALGSWAGGKCPRQLSLENHARILQASDRDASPRQGDGGARCPTPKMPPRLPDTPPGWQRRMHTVYTLTVAYQTRASKGNTQLRSE